ncbi:MAG: dehydrogenase/acetyl-CoA synthase complex, beta subunit, partial [Methanomicrobia archaeon]|nr:dehydrogenase/acetyl-CoA synthase complex, beta subunit [Methanomicrobia archaeon]
KELKDRLRDYLPEEIRNRIATEEEAKTVPDLRAFLAKAEHPVTARWTGETTARPAGNLSSAVFSAGDLPITAGGIRIIFKNARIHAERVIIQPVTPRKDEKGAR